MHACELDVATARTDWQYHAQHGASKFEDIGSNEKLRFLFSLHPDLFPIVSRKGPDLLGFEDPRGKVVNTGHAGSGIEATINLALETFAVIIGMIIISSGMVYYRIRFPNGTFAGATTSSLLDGAARLYEQDGIA